MSEITIRQCDECSAQHGAVNNWWSIVGEPTQPTFVAYDEAERLTRVAKANYGPSPERLDYCSHNCVVTAFNRWLDTGNVVKQERDSEMSEAEYARLVMPSDEELAGYSERTEDAAIVS